MQTSDMRYFLCRTEHLDAAKVRQEVDREIDGVMDDELISSLEAALVDAGQSSRATPERLDRYSGAYAFLKKLRKLQQARLRASILKFTQFRN